ncbi:MAG: hypothetical protein GEV11_08460 [Streptosporangiales bacterium]|nr:hypothetical protein [Streptosporangiales bacterium]
MAELRTRRAMAAGLAGAALAALAAFGGLSPVSPDLAATVTSGTPVDQGRFSVTVLGAEAGRDSASADTPVLVVTMRVTNTGRETAPLTAFERGVGARVGGRWLRPVPFGSRLELSEGETSTQLQPGVPVRLTKAFHRPEALWPSEATVELRGWEYDRGSFGDVDGGGPWSVPDSGPPVARVRTPVTMAGTT